MTITSVARLIQLEPITRNDSTQSHQAAQSEVEAHIYNLIQQGRIFDAKWYLNLINRTNGYQVISKMQFKHWHIEHLRNEKSNISLSEIENQNSKNQNKQNRNINYQSPQKDKSNNESSDFHKEFQKAYMRLISN